MTEGNGTATPYNRPIPQWETRYVPEDPTANPLAVGGYLKLNDQDRAALNGWFQSSFMNQFQHQSTWFRADWFPEFFAPIRDRINENFDKAFDTLRKHDEEVVQLRKEMTAEITKMHRDTLKEMSDWIRTKDKDFSREVGELRGNIRKDMIARVSDDLNTMRDDLISVLRVELADEFVGAIEEVRKELRAEMRREVAAKIKSLRSIKRKV